MAGPCGRDVCDFKRNCPAVWAMLTPFHSHRQRRNCSATSPVLDVVGPFISGLLVDSGIFWWF